MAKAKTNIAHSVAQRILDIHRETGERNEYLLQRRTFARRETDLPVLLPVALTGSFSGDPIKNDQWLGFVRLGNLTLPVGSLTEVVAELRVFFVPLLTRLKIG